MCGRYVFNPGKPDEFYDRYTIENRDIKVQPNYNVAPGQIMPTITRNSPNKITMMKWGLIPFWAKDPKIGYKMINARAETVAEKPSFRRSLTKQRCLVPTSGFYEWKKYEKSKIPYFIHLKNNEIFSFAGLYDIWIDAEGKETISYTIITTTPNKLMEKIHDRMPVIISKKNEEEWLDGLNNNTEKLQALLVAYDENEMEAYPVSTKVNSPINNTQDLLDKAF